MPSRLRSLVLLALLLVLPAQGVAAAVNQVLCAPSIETGHDHPASHHDSLAPGHSHDASHHHGDDGDAESAGHAGHLCCHLAANAIPTAGLAMSPGAAPVLQPTFVKLSSLFDPEQPQRPPRG